MKKCTFFLIKMLFLITPIMAKDRVDQFTHPNNLYNNGLQFYYNSEYGPAMKCIKKAMLLAPNNKQIRTLFYQLRREIGLPVVFTQDNVISRMFAVFFNAVPPQWNAILGSFLLLIVSLIVFLPVKKKKYILYIIGMFSTSVVLLSVGLIRYYIFFNVPDRIATHIIDLYEEPDVKSKKNITLPAGSELRVVDQIGEFLLVKTLDKREAWVQEEFVPPLWE
ncbi:hypothetical protein SAMN02745150_00712 [Brevinema andersonii]|uniref:Uncharacterized protein n=1 Tax=Brevinema andersonii TaxID=34097 RepID=A0A1I1DRA8_BREAD|nr:SH3 domain-containing protein [Brevinema andersonii]SFB76956.1 hypothetical protein SAMN02745150_00712 [Brevinema andersonii]